MTHTETEGRRGAVIREYNPDTDRDGTEAVDWDCDVGPGGGMSLHADLLGDPVARIRHSRRTTACSVRACVYVCSDACVWLCSDLP